MVFLGFEMAFNRLKRAWIERCMAAVGVGPEAQRWVHILHSGTTARVAYNGWHTDAFPVRSGVFQGSPLSPLLFVLATQPMAAHARRLALQQAFQPIRLPSGDPAPVMHQHADDTSIHARSPRDAQVILDTSVDLHCAAIGSKLQHGKSQVQMSLMHLYAIRCQSNSPCVNKGFRAAHSPSKDHGWREGNMACVTPALTSEEVLT